KHHKTCSRNKGKQEQKNKDILPEHYDHELNHQDSIEVLSEEKFAQTL
ncbi:19609_t:CDS:1, partial [Cetraspora pellucida]